jgi:hypothetical protein
MNINVENLSKSVNMIWMSDRPRLKSHGMGPHVNAVCQISRDCVK